MPRGKKELAEQIIPKLREVEVEVGRGKTVIEPKAIFWECVNFFRAAALTSISGAD